MGALLPVDKIIQNTFITIYNGNNNINNKNSKEYIKELAKDVKRGWWQANKNWILNAINN